MSEEQNGDCFVTAANIIACYDMPVLADGAAREAINLLKSLNISTDQLWLCHSWVTRPSDGRVHVHAWVEINGKGLVLDFANVKRVLMPFLTYYEAGNIKHQEVERYNATQARRKLVNYEHYGPWGRRFRTEMEGEG